MELEQMAIEQMELEQMAIDRADVVAPLQHKPKGCRSKNKIHPMGQ